VGRVIGARDYAVGRRRAGAVLAPARPGPARAAWRARTCRAWASPPLVASAHARRPRPKTPLHPPKGKWLAEQPDRICTTPEIRELVRANIEAGRLSTHGLPRLPERIRSAARALGTYYKKSLAGPPRPPPRRLTVLTPELEELVRANIDARRPSTHGLPRDKRTRDAATAFGTRYRKSLNPTPSSCAAALRKGPGGSPPPPPPPPGAAF
jgi:hypothetical protein